MVTLTMTYFLCFFLKGPILSVKQLSDYQEPKCDNPKTLILLLKLWNYLYNRRYRAPNLSGGAPFSATCACVYNQEKMCPFHLDS